ncbi:MAG TPA: type II toxin-antitoxin system VapC family toxin [Thermoanaerobaculia bacterium]|nr:type II toxin-antitoxin system VapC family toxin [Thermoanaerobaculia bacterium]
MIVDSSAVLAILFHEIDAEALLSAITGASVAGIGSPTAVETGLVLTARLQRDATGMLLRFFGETGIEIVPFTTRHWQRAIEAFARFGKGRHPAGLNFGDCMTYATAALARQPLLCVGDDFGKTDLELIPISG